MTINIIEYESMNGMIEYLLHFHLSLTLHFIQTQRSISEKKNKSADYSIE